MRPVRASKEMEDREPESTTMNATCHIETGAEPLAVRPSLHIPCEVQPRAAPLRVAIQRVELSAEAEEALRERACLHRLAAAWRRLRELMG